MDTDYLGVMVEQLSITLFDKMACTAMTFIRKIRHVRADSRTDMICALRPSPRHPVRSML
ncbi:hypothetical protein B586_10765 [Mycobacterium haemophilum DSM 44634]|uniref:Uncharacterized protein n=1 Tax=Mycobacterium haemophilum TaxID=29311 RepID=A0A0I9TER4_9MYCO|nr:hypothetical protein B586_10765 [Mycobacterium haemophilum DSM 44634]KLO26670.1 hypothetical protein ABH39_17340 [Mycobacterium haemophilum]KLO34790.1 hypothetical protein ABH38_17800 [Mycobacterium haemophilum]KLO39722.1 hypothetical protein ABH37_17620 [Mycobacterium haemophilum]KLO46841.1 hypothetical protein ABH36_17730 [Mycobacterium haemophilum]